MPDVPEIDALRLRDDDGCVSLALAESAIRSALDRQAREIEAVLKSEAQSYRGATAGAGPGQVIADLRAAGDYLVAALRFYVPRPVGSHYADFHAALERWEGVCSRFAPKEADPR